MNNKATATLRALEQQLKKCVKCGSCRANCPAFSAFCREPATARGKIALAQHILKGSIPLDDKTRLAMSKCLLCGGCVEKCPNGVPIDQIVIATREALAREQGLTTFHALLGRILKKRSRAALGAKIARLVTPCIFKKIPATSGLRLRFPLPFVDSARQFPTLARKPFLERHPEVIPGEPDKPRVVFFVGCMINFVYPQVGEAALALFRHLGCTLIIPRSQQCCGLPAMSGGDMTTVMALVNKNLEILEQHQADYIVSACATCGSTLQRLYPLLTSSHAPELKPRLEALAAKTIDATSLLLKLGLQPARTAAGAPLRLTYHDPCHLRTHGIVKQPRELLRAVPGLQLLEMEAPERCCGLGGTFNAYHYDASMEINNAKSAAIINTAAQIAATACPGCMMQLSDGLQRHNSPIVVAHILEILARNLDCLKHSS